MDKIKGFINDLTGGDGKLDGDDISNASRNANVEDLKSKADSLGLGNIDLDLLKSLEFPLTKDEIISQLKAAGTNDTLLSVVEKVPDQVYENINQLRDKLPF